ncbi:hypothetical protein THASP1DRAFT_30707 [Thamnocephalis sphaerospora]|uniref:COP9 signalosome complex subunit 3 n=1 Tax=Thamnocephalis sphaerospora TaxID=78915 RepID=A0A4P9XNF3_9FUNG|nr:hypothetical protein THASP1DRAFT_30707 [Thamnocephalis sphaerospora]|eukprot:RKP07478.1 hypothetical protein THASP1DRAFT_30707 [Thamnocephalis sphaerospora]
MASLSVFENLKKKDHKQQLSELRQLPSNALVGIVGQEDVLSRLDAKADSIIYLYVIVERCQRKPSFHDTVQHLDHFVDHFDAAQIRGALPKFNLIGDVLLQWTKLGLNPIYAIRLLSKAIKRIQPAPGYLTALHAPLFRIALTARRPHAALSLLEESVTNISVKDTGVKVVNFLLYAYYGGMLFALMKRYDEALLLFQQAITTPAESASSIQVAASKKHTLISLIHRGTETKLPQYVSNTVVRISKYSSVIYKEITDVFAARNMSGFNELINVHKDSLEVDGNYGLALQLPAAMRRFAIIKLTRVYANMSLERIASEVGLQNAAEAEQVILGMIDAGDIRATITRQDGSNVKGSVRFHEATPVTGLPAIEVDLARVATQIQHMAKLSEQMREEELSIICKKQYLERHVQSSDNMDEIDYMTGGYSSMLDRSNFM